MWPVMQLGTCVVMSSAAIVLNGMIARLGMPDLARRRVYGVTGAVLAANALAHAAWLAGPTFPLKYWGATVASILLCFAVALVPAMVVAAILRALAKRAVKVAAPPSEAAPPAASLSRRAFVGAVTAAAPAAAASAGVVGFGTANDAPNTPRVRLEVDDLPRELEGFRVLHLSDLHLGIERRTRDVEALVETLQASGRVPDLVVLTGDVAEDPAELVPSMRALARLGARHGVIASLGNHEYFGDVRRTRRDYEKAGVPLLVSAGHTLRIGEARLHLAGLDDPRAMHGDHDPFFTRSMHHALNGAPQDAVHVVLSHRPEALETAAREKLDLVLSGHTHGGQIGFANKSAFEPIWPEKYLWGRYRRERTQLYTTSGFGHWFPFRFLCPTEAPLLELTARDRSSSPRSARRTTAERSRRGR